ncbi:MAG: carboxypeptidase regulatory-like domain-containing protein, partial [Bacteroidota bacterium]
ETTVVGRVTDFDTGEILEGVFISTSPSIGNYLTDSEGRFQMDSVSLGTYSIRFRLDEYRDEIVSVDLTDDRTINLEVRMSKVIVENTPPNTPEVIYPADLSVDLSPDTVTLRWTSSDLDAEDELTYDLILIRPGSNPELLLDNTTDTTYQLSGLDYSAEYQWQVIVNDGNNAPVNGPIWAFKTIQLADVVIAYTKRAGDNDILTIFGIDENGGEVQLTDGVENSWRPRLSPDGSRIAFFRYDNSLGAPHLYIMNADGTNMERVSPAGQPVRILLTERAGFSWSPNGESIYYPSNGGALYNVLIDGTGIELVIRPEVGKEIQDVTLSQENNRLMYYALSTDLQSDALYQYSFSGDSSRLFLAGDGILGGPFLSYSGERFLYTQDLDPQTNSIGRRWNAHVYLIDWPLSVDNISIEGRADISNNKPLGKNDLNPTFDATESKVLVTTIDNDALLNPNKIPDLTIIDLENINQNISRELLRENGSMGDW